MERRASRTHRLFVSL